MFHNIYIAYFIKKITYLLLTQRTHRRQKKMTTPQPELPSRRAPRPARQEQSNEPENESENESQNAQTPATQQQILPQQRSRVVLADLFDTSSMKLPKTNLDDLDIDESATETVIKLDNSPYLLDLVRRSMEDGRPIWYDIPRFTVPGGGNNAFAGFNGRMENELSGVVLAIHNIRQFYAEEKTDDSPNTLPICVSIDNRTGVGNPGGKCQTCPYRQRNPALPTYCRRKTWMFIARPGEDLPTIIDLTGAASMGLNSQTIEDSYLRNKLPVGVHVEHIVSEFHLESHPNYNTGNRKASIIKGKPIARVNFETEQYKNALDFVKIYLQGVVENWADYMAENSDVSTSIAHNVVDGRVASAQNNSDANDDIPDIPDSAWDDEDDPDDLPF